MSQIHDQLILPLFGCSCRLLPLYQNILDRVQLDFKGLHLLWEPYLFFAVRQMKRWSTNFLRSPVIIRSRLPLLPKRLTSTIFWHRWLMNICRCLQNMEILCDGKPYACAASIWGAGFIQTIKFFEQGFQFIIRNGFSVIADRYNDMLRCFFRIHCDFCF